MIVTVDGYDGTGKTTLARRIEAERDFYYVEKPFILKYEIEHKCSHEEAVKGASEEEAELYRTGTTEDKIRYYLDAILWLGKLRDKCNIVLDRGILTTYAVFGTKENEHIFKEYLDKGIGYDLSFYLTADDMVRHRRIVLNDPNDPDLKYGIKWRENNLDEFAEDERIKRLLINTDEMSREEVGDVALQFLDDTMGVKPSTILSKRVLIRSFMVINNEVPNN